MRRNRFLRTRISGYSDVAVGAVNIGLDICRESKLDLDARTARAGELRGERKEEGTGFWNQAKSGFVRRTSLSICSRISLS